MGRIIGKGGGNVREMQRLTGAVIKLPEQVFASSKFCSVSKSKNGKRHANSLPVRARQLEKRRACTSSVRSTRLSLPSAGSEPWWRDRQEESRPTRCCPCNHHHHHHHHHPGAPPAAQRRGRGLVAFLVHGRTTSALVHVEDVDHDDDIVHLEDALLEHQSSTLLSAEPTPTARFFKQDFQKPQLQESMHGTSRFRNTFFPVIRKHKAYSNSNFARTGFTLIMQPHPM